MREEVDEARFVVTEYEYDGNENRTLVRKGEATNGNQPANVVRTVYDERDLVYRVVRAGGHPNQATQQYDYDGNGNVAVVREGLEGDVRVTLEAHDGYDRSFARRDPMGNVTEYAYDANGNRVAIRREGELVDLPGMSKNIRLSEATYTHDPLNRRIREETAFFDTASQTPLEGGQVTGASIRTFEYNDDSSLARVVDDNLHPTTTLYDTASRPMRVVDAKGNEVLIEYDANSNVIRRTEVERSDRGSPDEFFVTRYEYDSLDRRVRTIDPAGDTMDFGYDSRGNRTRVMDALRPSGPSDPGNVTRYEYDGLDRLVATTYVLTEDGTGAGLPIGEIRTTRTWDDSSRLVARTDDGGNTTSYAYDPLDRRTSETFADGTSREMVLDVHGNAVETVDPNGSVIVDSHDRLDRLVQRTVNPGPGVSADTTFESHAYDGLSRLVSARDDDSRVTRAYDSLSNVTSEMLDGVTTTSTYDGDGNRVECVYPSGRVIRCTYDVLDRKQAVEDAGGLIASYEFIGPSRVERRTYGNGVVCDYAYDADRRIVGTHHVYDPDGAAVVIDSRGYAWDRMDNKVQRADLRAGGPGLTHAYSYDSIYRLRRTVVTDGASQLVRDTSYELDGVGNRISVTDGECEGVYRMVDRTPEPADRQMNQYTVTPCDGRRLHDRNGNLVRTTSPPPVESPDQHGSERTLVYDYADRLVRILEVPAGRRSTYRYDALGRRIEKLVSAIGSARSESTRFFYTGWQVCEELDAGGSATASYVYGLYIDEILEAELDGGSRFYHGDDLHSVFALTDAEGVTTDRYRYGDFGTPRFLGPEGEGEQETVANARLFTGRRYDRESDLYYFRTRYFHGASGRFVSRDRIGLWGDRSNMGNATQYPNANPLTFVDPFGKERNKVVCMTFRVCSPWGNLCGVTCSDGSRYDMECDADIFNHEGDYRYERDEGCGVARVTVPGFPSGSSMQATIAAASGSVTVVDCDDAEVCLVLSEDGSSRTIPKNSEMCRNIGTPGPCLAVTPQGSPIRGLQTWSRSIVVEGRGASGTSSRSICRP